MAKKKRTWDRWEAIGASFAEGGQGRIYEVADTSKVLMGSYVLKELKNPKRSNRYNAELEAILMLSEHPNVIDIVDHGIFRSIDKPCYVMSKADCSLDKIIESKDISVEQKFDIFKKICCGVSFLHSKSIIHRDIKPENILMFSGIPKVADFGLCLIAGFNRETQTNEAVGPRYYMAPELEDGQHLEVKVQADIYSLGKLFYYILSNGKMFSREKYKEYNWKLENILQDPRFNLFNSLFERSINISVSRRYSSVDEFICSLENILTEYRNHPRTLISCKFSNINESLFAAPDILKSLKPKEWLELLTTLDANDELFNEVFLRAACDSLSSETLDVVLKVVLGSESYLDGLFTIDASKRIISFAVENQSSLLFISDENLSKLIENASKKIDLKTINIISNFGASQLFKNKLMVQIVADNIELLGSKEKSDFLIFTYNKDYVGKESILTNIFDPETKDLLALEAVIAGLLKVGSTESIQLVFNFANRVETVDEEFGAVCRGVSLGLSSNNSKKIKSLNWTNSAIKILLDTHSQVVLESVLD